MALKQYVKDQVSFLESANFKNQKMAREALEKTYTTLACLEFVAPGHNPNVEVEIEMLLDNENFRDEAFAKAQHNIGLTL